ESRKGVCILDIIENVIDVLNDFLWTYVLIAVLIGLGIWLTFKTNFVQFRYLPEMFRVLFDKRTMSAEGKKGTSSFQAFAISAASRLGTGNLAGVATAIEVCGPVSIYWIFMHDILGSATAFIESTLVQVYKVLDNTQYHCGPAYYIEKGFKKRCLEIVFAITITFTFGLVFNSV